MLILTRKLGERFVVGDDVIITIVDIDKSGRVRVGIDAPPDVPVNREEILPRPIKKPTKPRNPPTEETK